MNTIKPSVPTSNAERYLSPSGNIAPLDLDQPESAVDLLREEFIEAGWVLIEPAPDTAAEPSLLDAWFEYSFEEDVHTWALPSELSKQSHFVHRAASDTSWTIMPADIPNGSMSPLDALTYADELNRCIAAAMFLNGQAVDA